MNYVNTNLQPGDGTRYTIMMADAGRDGVLVAIGAGSEITGGYYAQPYGAHVSALLKDICLGHDSDHRHIIDYYESHAKVGNFWTGLTAVTMAWLFTNSPFGLDERSKIIGHVYRKNTGLLLEALEAELALADRMRSAMAVVTPDRMLQYALTFTSYNLEPDDVETLTENPDAEVDTFIQMTNDLYTYFGGAE